MGSFLYFSHQAGSLPLPVAFFCLLPLSVSFFLSVFLHLCRSFVCFVLSFFLHSFPCFFLSPALSNPLHVQSCFDFATSALFAEQLPERIGTRGRSGTGGSGQCLLNTPARDCGWPTMSLGLQTSSVTHAL